MRWLEAHRAFNRTGGIFSIRFHIIYVKLQKMWYTFTQITLFAVLVSFPNYIALKEYHRNSKRVIFFWNSENFPLLSIFSFPIFLYIVCVLLIRSSRYIIPSTLLEHALLLELWICLQNVDRIKFISFYKVLVEKCP